MRTSRPRIRRPAAVSHINANPTPALDRQFRQAFAAPHLTGRYKGQWAESVFQNLAIAMGFTVCKPWGNDSAYDFIIERAGRMLRIQVKAAFSPCHNQYGFKAKRSPLARTERFYTENDIDFFACLVAPLDIWYIIPISALSTRQGGIYVRPPEAVVAHKCPPRGTRSYEHYRERWDLLHKRSEGTRFSVYASSPIQPRL